MILECPNVLFGRIALVDVRWYQLEGALIGSNGMLKSHADFVVKDVKCRCKVARRQAIVDVLVGDNLVAVMF